MFRLRLNVTEKKFSWKATTTACVYREALVKLLPAFRFVWRKHIFLLSPKLHMRHGSIQYVIKCQPTKVGARFRFDRHPGKSHGAKCLLLMN